MAIYDRKQLNSDLLLIVGVFGKRVPHGFFTIRVYNDGVFRIVDDYSKVKIYHKNVQLEKGDIYMNTYVSNFILKKVLEAEELIDISSR